jgi:hypothetical protein
LRALDLNTWALAGVTLTAGADNWVEPTAMTYAPGTGQFYLASAGGQDMPSLYRMTLTGDTATEEFVGTLQDDMYYPLTMNGLAFRYDKAFPAPEVTLDGSGSSDPDGDSLLFAWRFLTVPDGSALTDADLSDPTGETTTFTPDVLGAYELELVVNDGEVDSAAVTVTVNYLNMPPVANAGADQTVLEGQYNTPVQLNGGESYDPDSELLTFAWTFLSVPTGSIIDDTWIDASSAAPSFWADVASNTEPYALQLTVTDPDGESSTDTVEVFVQEAVLVE